MRIKAVSAGMSVCVVSLVFALAFGSLGHGRATAAAGSAPVTITNTTVPITGTVALVPSQPFAANGNDETEVAPFASDKFSVPAGKRLIVELVTLEAEVPAGGLATCGLTATEPASPDGLVGHRFAMTPQGEYQLRDRFVATLPVRLYFGPGAELIWFCQRNNGAGFITFGWSISGYLVDV